MKIGIVGSRSLDMPIPESVITDGVTMIYTGGAAGIDKRVRDFAYERRIKVTEILPEYNLYRKNAPLVRNELIVRMSDAVYVFWDGKSHGTENVIKKCKELHKPCRIYLWKEDSFVVSEDID